MSPPGWQLQCMVGSLWEFEVYLKNYVALVSGCASALCTCMDACMFAHLPVASSVLESLRASVCVCVCGRWNNEVDYESLSGVTRRNGSITRYVQQRQSTAERGERLGHGMTFWFWREKVRGRQRKRQRRKKNGETEAKKRGKKKQQRHGHCVSCNHLISCSFHIVCLHLSALVLYLLTTSLPDGFTSWNKMKMFKALL